MRRKSTGILFLVCLGLVLFLIDYHKKDQAQTPTPSATQEAAATRASVPPTPAEPTPPTGGQSPLPSPAAKPSASAPQEFLAELRTLIAQSRTESKLCDEESDGDGFFQVAPPSTIKALKLIEKGVPSHVVMGDFYKEFGEVATCGKVVEKFERFKQLLAEKTNAQTCQNIFRYISRELDAPLGAVILAVRFALLKGMLDRGLFKVGNPDTIGIHLHRIDEALEQYRTHLNSLMNSNMSEDDFLKTHLFEMQGSKAFREEYAEFVRTVRCRK